MKNLKSYLNIAINFLLIFVVLNNTHASNLSCTNENGLQIVYLNGVNTSYTYAESTARNIENIIKTDSQVAQRIEYSEKIDVGFVHNESLGLHSDMLELRNQVFYSFNKESRQNYYLNQLKEKFEKIEAFNLDLFRNAPGNYLSHVNEETRKEHAKLREALVKLTGKNYKELNKSFDEYEASYRNTFKSYDNSVRNLFELAFYDTKTSDMTSSRMSAILAGKKDPYLKDESSFNKSKLIMIAHSQGNQMLETAYNQVFHPTDETYMSNDEKINYKKYLGILNVASPSSSSTMGCLRSNGSGIINADCRNEAIKLNTDLIIFGSSYVIQPPSQYAMKPNFTVDEIKTSGIFAKEISPLKPDIARGLIESYLGTTFRHGMNEVYLSDKFYAIEESSTTPSKKLKDAFIRKLASVAESLESNCSLPEAVISYDIDPRSLYVGEKAVVLFNAKKSLPYRDEPQRLERFKSIMWEINGFPSEIYSDGVTRWYSRKREAIKGEGEEFTFHFRVAEEYTIKLTVEREDGVVDVSEFKFSTRNRDAKVGEITTTCILKPSNYVDEVHSGYIADHDSGEYGYYYSEDSSGDHLSILTGDSNYVREDLKALTGNFVYVNSSGDGKKQPVVKKTIWVFKRHKFINDSPLIPMGTMSYDLFSCDRE